MANYSHDRVVNCTFENNGVYKGHNFTQKYPHTKIAEGFTGLTFENCNLVNCDVPVGSVVKSCNIAQISRCGNIEGNDGYTCPVECEHMVSKEDVVVDGVLIDTLYEYKDKVVS